MTAGPPAARSSEGPAAASHRQAGLLADESPQGSAPFRGNVFINFTFLQTRVRKAIQTHRESTRHVGGVWPFPGSYVTVAG